MENTLPTSEMPPRFLEVELDDWAPLGAPCRLDLSRSRTVLVGRNGAGKSLLLEGIKAAAYRATVTPHQREKGFEHSDQAPRRFSCVVVDGERANLLYQYQIHEPKEGRSAQLEEECARATEDQPCWRVHEGRAQFRDGTAAPVPSLVGVLNFEGYLHHLSRSKNDEIATLRRLFTKVRLIPAGVPRLRRARAPLVVTVEENGPATSYLSPDVEDRMAELVMSLVVAQRDDLTHYDEFCELGKRVGAWQELRVEHFSSRPPARAHHRSLATVSVDGVDLGLAADGTLRVAEILWWLVSKPGATLLIEEPETGIHPGLLSSLLDTFDGYAIDRQIILSTHSPQVVNRTEPRDLRLVERHDGRTRVRGLTNHQIGQVAKYLDDRSLGDYVYTGALSDE